MVRVGWHKMAAAVLAVGALYAPMARAQAAPRQPAVSKMAFEAATIKPATPGTAMQERAPSNVIVIDQAARPTEN